MNETKIKFIIIAIVSSICFNCSEEPTRDLYPSELVGGLELLSSEKTGIDFSNTIKESTYFNHYYYSQMYVGSGVAIGDINNDGLADVFFGGNQVADRLYLNKGNFQFENITKKSKVARNSGWTWGVTMADVNADGYLDIYVSRNGNSAKAEDRRNQLYINNQDLTFTESAQLYGLADAGFSTQAVFFDMDNDGDLDMYQVNQLADKKLLLVNKIPRDQFKFFRDKLYRNDNGRYKDVSEAMGISRDVAYGLSVNATDFNNDGWMDLYVANDYSEPDFMYYNNGDGTFKNVIHEKLKHITQLSMGSDTGDINNDGLIDLITTDMTPEDHYRSKTNMASMSTEAFNTLVEAGAHRQYMSNTLQINTGLESFSDIANMAGISFTDWSWASLLVDLDNDGLKDIIISNGIKKDVDNNDYRIKVQNLSKNATAQDLFQLSKDTPSQPISNYAFRNKGNLEFEKVSTKWGFNTLSFSNGMAYGDLDNDGDLDVITNNIDASAFVYENKATGNYLKIKIEGSENNTFGIGAKAFIYHNGKMQMAENTVTRGFLSSVEHNLFFGLGKDVEVEKVEVFWSNGTSNVYENVSANTTLTANYSDGKKTIENIKKTNSFFTQVDPTDLGIDYSHKENDFDEFKEEILLPHNISQNGPFTANADINGDGLEDLFIGGALGQSGVLYLQNTSGKFIKNKSQPWDKDKASEDLGCLFVDVDGDNDLDLYVASGGSEYKTGHPALKDRLYTNDGRGNFTHAISALPDIKQSSQCVKASDIDADGDLDLFVGTRLISRSYAFPATSYLLINENGKFKKMSDDIAPALNSIGMVTDAVFTDIDNDNDEDLMLVGEWMEIKLLINTSGIFEDKSEEFNLENTRGIWWSITASDLDGDGDEDYVIGNLGKNNKFKATEEHPFKVYANDFDNNGTNDVVFAKFYKNDYVPLRGRECTSQQMPYVAEKFKDYDSFASSKLIDILPEDKVDDAVVYEIKSFESIILINNNGKLIKQSLPNEAQISPVKSSLVFDINKDGYKDIVTVGNHYGVEVETTRYDAGFGTVLLGDGKNNFKSMSAIESGFYVPYDSRTIQYVNQKDTAFIFVTNNDTKPSVFKIKM
ncbi:VCBS repeat-containing protein [Winogradskyella sp. UBA3174]|uniref:VCBS repeat-containing protein n=1 Tax=Winogradskyella sp. UBA3174 TaxID=1947785 RepID=UPI0025DA5A8C|nr:VCBS repeat-containing protein [Winogradskyella sp. UBA3174]|tara:strand:+ start:1719 stop:5015 length:3297 start_codon:yes stop_codon:yes gene_type:complete